MQVGRCTHSARAPLFDACTTVPAVVSSPVMRQRIRWLALHGVVRRLSTFGLRSGDPQARLIADPAVRENPAAFADEVRGRGPVIRCRAVLMTFDHGVAHELLRSDDFRVTELGGNLPKPLRWLARKTD